jgi:ATPase family associated with various cellular activities (AAA)
MITPIAREKSFLDQRFSRASLRDHLRFERHRQRRDEVFDRHVRSFLRADDSEIGKHRHDYPYIDVPQITLALEHCFPDWKLVNLGGGMYGSCRPWTPSCGRFETSLGVFRLMVITGTWFFELPDGQRRIFSIDDGHTPGFREFILLCRSDEEPAALDDLRRLNEWIERHHYLKGTTIDVRGNRLFQKESFTWDDVALADDVRETLLANIRQFMALRDVFVKNGVPHRRGLLLYGPPGNGKTLVGKVLRATEPATFMYVTAADADDASALREAFALARRLKPTIVFLEDLDMYAAQRGSSPDCRALGEILAQLDGLRDNDGLMVIATTNDLTAIEPALRDRPNRFDVLLEVGPPDTAARRKILGQRLAKTAPQEDDFLDAAVALTDGFSGAQVQEAAWRIIQHTILSGSVTPEGIARPTRRDVEAALPRVANNVKRRRVGFGECANGCGNSEAHRVPADLS